MITCLGKSCSFGLPRVPFFLNFCQFMYLVISLLVFEGRMWDLIVSVPDHCLSFYIFVLCFFFVLEFYGPVNNELCRAGKLKVALFLGRLRPSKRLTSTKRLPFGFNSRNHNISVIFSRLSKDRTLEREDR